LAGIGVIKEEGKDEFRLHYRNRSQTIKKGIKTAGANMPKGEGDQREKRRNLTRKQRDLSGDVGRSGKKRRRTAERGGKGDDAEELLHTKVKNSKW